MDWTLMIVTMMITWVVVNLFFAYLMTREDD